MGDIEDIRLNYFQQCLDIIADLKEVTTQEELVDSQYKLEQLLELSSVLKHIPLLASYNNDSVVEADLEVVSEEELTNEKDVESYESFASPINFELAGRAEESLQVEEDEEQNLSSEKFEESEESPIEEDQIELQKNEDTNEQTPDNIEHYEESIEIDTEAEESLEEVIEMHAKSQEIIPELFEPVDYNAPHRQEKKFKLASIKGLGSSVHSLFEDSQNEEVQEQREPISAVLPENQTLSHSGSTRMGFKLDLNDRIAFTKTLFNGSQSELNHTVNSLNEFKTLEEAKSYLSEVYYQRNWKKVDEYAQRLWNLVESKFQ